MIPRIPTLKKPCIVCNEPFFTFSVRACSGYVCGKAECRNSFMASFDVPKWKILVFPDTVACSRPGCEKTLPPGIYSKKMTKPFCSESCKHKAGERYVIGQCAVCDKNMYGLLCQVGTRECCDDDCRREHRRIQVRQRTGPFAEQILAYVDGPVKTHYGASNWSGVKSSLVRFHELAASSGLTAFEDVAPAHTTAFILHEQERGVESQNYLNHVSIFYRWLSITVNRQIVNPVIPYWHKSFKNEVRPRPYSQEEIDRYWRMLDGRPDLQFAFSLGLESGLRIGEACDVRVPDLDASKQTVFVRLPTKSKRERTTYCDVRTLNSLSAWSVERDARCVHDNILHNTRLNPYYTETLCNAFSSHFESVAGTRVEFSFHRLRHTWASNLLNNGIEPAVLMKLGGWSSWHSMQFYIRLLQETVDRSYHDAIEKMKQMVEEEPESVFSMVEFVESELQELINPAL